MQCHHAKSHTESLKNQEVFRRFKKSLWGPGTWHQQSSPDPPTEHFCQIFLQISHPGTFPLPNLCFLCISSFLSHPPLIQTPNTAWSSMELSWNHQEFRRQRGWCTKTTLKWKLSEICIYSHSQPWQHNIKLQQGGRKQELSSVLIAPSAGFKNRLGQSCRKPSWRLLFLIIFFSFLP